jgi:hypothetical protein
MVFMVCLPAEKCGSVAHSGEGLRDAFRKLGIIGAD